MNKKRKAVNIIEKLGIGFFILTGAILLGTALMIGVYMLPTDIFVYYMGSSCCFLCF